MRMAKAIFFDDTNLFIKTATDFCVDKICEIFDQIFHTLLHIVHFVCVINGSREMANEPHQTVLIHWIQFDHVN